MHSKPEKYEFIGCFDGYVADSVSPKRDSPLLAVICPIWQVRHCSSSRTSAWVGHLFMSISTAPIISERSLFWAIRTVICNDIVLFFAVSVIFFVNNSYKKEVNDSNMANPLAIVLYNLGTCHTTWHGRAAFILVQRLVPHAPAVYRS